ncbi:peptidase M16 domain protein [Catenulispora acidiphila DSM 44928]|uniref:Peptidase M16 domain protein n=1 Tax=Catenulispora acidiphila (strain DSM 44928 / JCM 14897 / NBRC 102108 / NRRL B-24433 / ID139908) TaxID=479433 RepID=C7Q7A9_CATAD|nr:pitrilysin family protein [Catenulispora acidiphila]ACU70197.1 peptidase M16 domain protein [Catenulispora acidiphila DSM 44928]
MTEVKSEPGETEAEKAAAASFPWPIHEAELDNGLRVVVSPDPTTPIAAVNLWYDVGSRHERAGKHGFAHLFEHLMFEGSAHVAKGEHFEWVTAAGGAAINATTSPDRTNYFQVMPSSQLELALWLEADRMGSLALTQETLDNQREVVKNERRQRYDNPPYGRWVEYALELTFPEGHPYHHTTIGSMEELQEAALEDFQDFNAVYYSPNNAVLTVAGDVDVDEVVRLAEKYFGGITRHGDIPPAPDGELPALKIGETKRLVVPDDSVPRPMTFFMFRSPDARDEDFAAVEVLATVLGRGRGARLYRKLVTEKNLAQREESYTSVWNLAYGASVFFGLFSPRDGVEAADVEREFTAVLDALTDGSDPVSEAELGRATALLTSDWLRSVSELGGRADLLGQYATVDGDPKLVREYLARLEAVTAEDVQRVAALILPDDNRVVIEYVTSATPDADPADGADTDGAGTDAEEAGA